MPNRYAPPETGLPLVESVCANGHPSTDELDWKLPLVFIHDIALLKMCPQCETRLWIKAGSYEPTDGDAVYRRIGPPDLPKLVSHWG
ncbi:MAG: hypothetical protein ABIQ30_07970 [Devosia sp.]